MMPNVDRDLERVRDDIRELWGECRDRGGPNWRSTCRVLRDVLTSSGPTGDRYRAAAALLDPPLTLEMVTARMEEK
jgi:hypothetical protein